MSQHTPHGMAPWRLKFHEVIFEADTPAGRTFDLALMVAILASVVAVMLDSVRPIHEAYGKPLLIAEWVFTILFTVEYLLRLVCVRRPHAYALSFFGIVDLLAILPTYAMLILPESGVGAILVVRALRLLRIFRILKLARFLSESEAMQRAIWSSRSKIIVFLTAVLIVVAIMGSALYLVEGEANGFTSIPQSMYWAIVTMTTVGYGDIVPLTPIGKTLAAVIMILGYSFIIIPTGIISAEIARASNKPVTNTACHSCSHEGHDHDATFCKHCGEQL